MTSSPVGVNATPDCKNCPSFLRADEAPGVFNRSTGSPMCRTFGHVLGKPGATERQEKKIREHFAGRCPKYMNTASPAPVSRTMAVMLPDPTVRDPNNIDDTLKNAVNSCAQCKNFVPEDVVVDSLGWTTGLCRAKGKLLLTNKLSAEASGCEFRQFGQNFRSTAGLNFLPEYDDAFAVVSAAAEIIGAAAKNMVDPHDYESDAPVTDEERMAGIRAWRRYLDPENDSRSVLFPVYDRNMFSEELQALIPVAGGDEHVELYVDHFGGMYSLGVAWLELDETPALWGVPGTGKTEIYRHASWIMQIPFHRISISHSTELDDLFGKYEYTPDKGTYFRFGVLPNAWVSPGVICIDEPNTGPPEVWQRIRPLTDNSKQLIMDMYDGRGLDRNKDSFMGMAMNPAWDVRNVGALEISDADTNRLFHLAVDLPPEEVERKIIKDRVALDGWEISDETLNFVMATAKELRGLSEDQQVPITWAIRPQIKLARALRWFSPAKAYRRAAADFMEPEAAQVLMDIVRANWPEED